MLPVLHVYQQALSFWKEFMSLDVWLWDKQLILHKESEQEGRACGGGEGIGRERVGEWGKLGISLSTFYFFFK